MVNFFLNGLFWVLAIYGLIEITKTIYYTVTCTKLKSDGIYFIIAVKNQEKEIEMFIRSTIFRILYGKEENIKNIIITDLGSNDNTKKIIKKLSEDYDFINNMEWKNCKELIDTIDTENGNKPKSFI